MFSFFIIINFLVVFILFSFKETKIMVQLSPSRSRETLTTLEMEMDGGQGSPKSDSPGSFTTLQLTLSPSTTTYYGYEKYIEDGLICLKHKIRNIEKKKVLHFFKNVSF